jgi:hypothetical protein
MCFPSVSTSWVGCILNGFEHEASSCSVFLGLSVAQRYSSQPREFDTTLGSYTDRRCIQCGFLFSLVHIVSDVASPSRLLENVLVQITVINGTFLPYEWIKKDRHQCKFYQTGEFHWDWISSSSKALQTALLSIHVLGLHLPLMPAIKSKTMLLV